MRRTLRVAVWLGGTASTPALGVDLRPPTGAHVNVLTSSADPYHRRATAAHLQPSSTAIATQHLPAEARQYLAHMRVGVPQAAMHKFRRVLRADIYDELLKLPLRFALHDFERLQRHLTEGARGGLAHPLAEDEVEPGVFRFPPAETSTDGVPEDSGEMHLSSPYYAVSGRQASAVGYAPPLGPADPLDTIPFHVHRTSTGLLPGRVHSMDAKRLMPAFYLRVGNIDGDVFRFEEELIKIFPTKKIFVKRHAIYVYNVNLDGKSVLHHWLLGLGF